MTSKRPWSRWIAGAVTLLLAVSLPGNDASAQRGDTAPIVFINDVSVDWSAPLLAEPTLALFAPSNGYLIAQTRMSLYDSEDSGASWNPIQLPPWTTPFGRVVAVDPADGKTLYVTGEQLLYRSTSRGVIWEPILRDSYFPPDRVVGSNPHAVRVVALEVSPANPAMLYAVVTGSVPRESGGSGNSSFAFLRSTDGGVNWTTLLDEPYGDNHCRWAVDLLMAHPTDATRVFLARSCRAGSSYGAPLNQSLDQGATFVLPSWDQHGAPMTNDILGYPEHLVGGLGNLPSRWYLAVNRNFRRGGSTLLRSDDDAQTWVPVLIYRGGAIDPSVPSPGPWTVLIRSVAYDPTNPGHVYVARTAAPPFNILTGVQGPVVTSGVTESQDGGATWADLGSQQLGTITDLVLGADRQRLYIASDQGVRMMRLRP